jgi:hypothetical protein
MTVMTRVTLPNSTGRAAPVTTTVWRKPREVEGSWATAAAAGHKAAATKRITTRSTNTFLKNRPPNAD